MPVAEQSKAIAIAQYRMKSLALDHCTPGRSRGIHNRAQCGNYGIDGKSTRKTN